MLSVAIWNVGFEKAFFLGSGKNTYTERLGQEQFCSWSGAAVLL